MHQLLYTMQFKGYTAPVGASLHEFQVITIATSCTLTTAIGVEGVHSTLQLTGGGKAAFESVVTFTGENTFQESGSITFGGREAIDSPSAPSGRVTSLPAPSRLFESRGP